jgi:hypothetical protein
LAAREKWEIENDGEAEKNKIKIMELPIKHLLSIRKNANLFMPQPSKWLNF